MTNEATGPAALTIDSFFIAKFAICEGWDRALGLSETHPFSAVFALRAFYAVRRPFFVATAKAFLMNLPPSRGTHAIRKVSASAFGERRVIEGEFRQ